MGDLKTGQSDSVVRRRPSPYKQALLANVLALELLSGCYIPLLPGPAVSPEQAAIRAVLQTPKSMEVNATTVKVLQTEHWERETIVLVTFQAIQEDGRLSRCLFMYETQRSPQGEWGVSTGGGHCNPPGVDAEPIDLGGGQNSGTGRPALSHAKGLVYDERIKAIEVIWDDGENQRVVVINDSYLALRAGLHDYTEIRALDAEGDIIYTSEGQ